MSNEISLDQDKANRQSDLTKRTSIFDTERKHIDKNGDLVATPTNESVPRTSSSENTSSSWVECFTPIDYQFYKVIGILLESKGMQFSNDFLIQLTDLSMTYFHDLINSLQKNTEAQRRRTPSFEDTQVCFRINNVKAHDLYEQYVYHRDLSGAVQEKIKEITNQTSNILNDTNNNAIEEDDPSLPFFTNENYEISELVPKQSHRPNYIPNYLPDLPPDYTYQNTAEYSDTLTDLKKLRIRLVEESRLTEKSLYNLIEDDEHKWKKDFENQLEDQKYQSESEDSIMSDVEKFSQTDTETPNFENQLLSKEPKLDDSTIAKPNTNQEENKEERNETETVIELKTQDGELGPPVADSKQIKEVTKFDWVEYAKKRAKIKIRKEKELETKRSNRNINIFMKAEKYYSPYQSLPVTPEVDKYFASSINEEFKAAIKATRIAEKKKKKKIEKLLKERAKALREKELQKEKVEFGFNFNNINHMSDDESEDEVIDHNLLNFGGDNDNNSNDNFNILSPKNTPHGGDIASQLENKPISDEIIYEEKKRSD